MTPLSVVCWKWASAPGYRSTFGPETVNVLRSMVARNYSDPHRFICVTDDAEGIDPSVEILPPWDDFRDVPSPHGGKNPSCYRRLRMFHPEIGQHFGKRFVSMDLDTVITGDLRPVLNRPEAFVAWGDTNPRPGSHYNGSLMLMTAGARSQVWERFDPATSPKLSLRAGCWGSDQGWISYVLGKGEAKWSREDGVYSFRNHLQAARHLPDNCKIVFFHGKHDPWASDVQAKYPWVREHYGVTPDAVVTQ